MVVARRIFTTFLIESMTILAFLYNPSLSRCAIVILFHLEGNGRSVQSARTWRLRGVVKIKIKPEELIRTGQSRRYRWREGGNARKATTTTTRTTTAKKVRRQDPRINIHSCSTPFERPAYPRTRPDTGPTVPILLPAEEDPRLEIRSVSYAGLLFPFTAHSPSPPSHFGHLRASVSFRLLAPTHSSPVSFGPQYGSEILIRE